MTFRFPSLDEIVVQFIATFRRFPAAVISSLTMMFIVLYLIEQESSAYAHFETLIKIAFVASLGIFMFTALRLLGEKNPLCLVGIGALVIYYFSLPGMKQPVDMVFIRHFFFIVAFFIMILWAPFWKSAPSNEAFWEWSQRVVFGFITAIVFGIVLYAGLSGALYAVDKLFSLDISGKRYGQLVFLVIGLFGVNYFLSQIPKETESLKIHAYTKVENIFTKYILTPMAVGYFLILYAYTFKILLTSEWPKGILAWIIIAFSAVALVTYLFWTPLWSERAKKYKRFLFVVLFLQTIMLALAISMRISAYGWTENRYMVVILGLWLFGISLYFLLVKHAKYKWIFLVLTLLIMISQIGPLSAYAVGKSSQQKRLQTYLQTAGKLSEKSDVQTRFEISSMIEYLERHHGIESLKPIIPEIVSKYEDINETQHYYRLTDFATHELGFTFVSQWDIKRQKEGRFFSLNRPDFEPLDVSGYDWVIKVHFDQESAKKAMSPYVYAPHKNTRLDTLFMLDDKSLKIIEHNSTIAEIPLKDFYARVLADDTLKMAHPMELDTTYNKKLDIDYTDKNVSVKIKMFDIYTDINGSVESVRAKVLYRRF